MNRQLKFRVYGKDSKGFLYIELKPNAKVQDDSWRYNNYEDWEQYTGLIDKNGLEIYEGDILMYKGYHCMVVYRQMDCSFILENDEDEICASMWEDEREFMEVVGNIHETPKLLEDKK